VRILFDVFPEGVVKVSRGPWKRAGTAQNVVTRTYTLVPSDSPRVLSAVGGDVTFDVENAELDLRFEGKRPYSGGLQRIDRTARVPW
jgi:hypothetical protein